MDNDRLKHSIAVGRKMEMIAKNIGLLDDEIKDCFLIGFNHDIGYEFVSNGVNHNRIGGELLKKSGFKYWKEIYYHGDVLCEYDSLYLDILNSADMQIDKYGNDVGYDNRLKDIKKRYGEESLVYKNCCRLIDELKMKNIEE